MRNYIEKYFKPEFIKSLSLPISPDFRAVIEEASKLDTTRSILAYLKKNLNFYVSDNDEADRVYGITNQPEALYSIKIARSKNSTDNKAEVAVWDAYKDTTYGEWFEPIVYSSGNTRILVFRYFDNITNTILPQPVKEALYLSDLYTNSLGRQSSYPYSFYLPFKK